MTETELLEFIANERPYFKRIDMDKYDLNAVHDASNDTIIAITRNRQTAHTMIDNVLNTKVVYTINFRRELFPKEFDNRRPYFFKYFYRSPAPHVETNSPLTFEQMYYYALIAEKAAALDMLFKWIRDARRPFSSNLMFQDEVYRIKFLEAKQLLKDWKHKDKIIDPDDYPFVCEYAELANKDIIEAAKLIKLKYEFGYHRICASETMRLMYTKQIMECENITEIPNIVMDINKQGYKYGKM